jgi:uncharacterized protein (TIGR02757 family)
MTDLSDPLSALYRRLNRRAYVHPDPLELLYRYDKPQDQEIAGLVCACLAYGRVGQIIASCQRLLEPMGASPRAFLERACEREIRGLCAGFKHRFTTAGEAADLLVAVKRALGVHGSLEALFAAGMSAGDDTVIPALGEFVDGMRAFAGGADPCPTLLSSPRDGSACKRLNLWLRWMARRDAVDPGPWRSVRRSRLVVPLDTHLHRIARGLGLTARKAADMKTAIEITMGFARYSPRDPVKFDFCLTRLGINPACRTDEMQCILKGSV